MQTTGSDAGQAEGTNIMKDEKKDFEMKNDAGTDMTEEMPPPGGGRCNGRDREGAGPPQGQGCQGHHRLP